MGAVRPTSTLWEQVAGTEAPGFLDVRAELPDSNQEPGPGMLGGPPTSGSWGYSDPGAPGVLLSAMMLSVSLPPWGGGVLGVSAGQTEPG